MLDKFKFEAARLFTNKNIMIAFLAFTLLSIYFVSIGVGEYDQIVKDKEIFSQHENEKVSRYISYKQYGWFGFRVMFEPSPLMVFFRNTILFNNSESNVSTLENNIIYSLNEGRSLFQKGHFSDFSRLFLIFGSLFALLMGITNSNSDQYRKYINHSHCGFSALISRLVILNLIFSIIFAISFLWALINGITFSAQQTLQYVIYCFSILILLSFFFILGNFFTVLLKKRHLILPIVVWFLLVFILPEFFSIILNDKSMGIPSNESVGFEKFNNLMDLENAAKEALLPLIKRREKLESIAEIKKEFALKYLKDSYKKNLEIENDYLEKIEAINRFNQSYSVLVPSLFAMSLSLETSSIGYQESIRFYLYLQKLRKDFLEFYANRVYILTESEVEPFIKAGENLFQAESRLPGNYYAGLGVTVLYSLILLGISFFVLRRRMNKIPEDVKRPELTLQEGRSYFMFFKDAAYRDSTFDNYIRQENVSGIDRVEIEDIDFEITPRAAVKLISSIRGTDEGEVLEYLEIMGVSQQELNAKRNTPELLRKIYAASQIGDGKIIVINEFLKDLSRSFEKDFLKLVKELKSRGKMFVYMSIEFLNLEIESKERIEENIIDYNFTEMAIENASMR